MPYEKRLDPVEYAKIIETDSTVNIVLEARNLKKCVYNLEYFVIQNFTHKGVSF